MLAQGFSDGFRLRMDLQFSVDVLQVERDSVGRNAHLARGGLLVMPFNQQLLLVIQAAGPERYSSANNPKLRRRAR